jgi:hypothetical protein
MNMELIEFKHFFFVDGLIPLEVEESLIELRDNRVKDIVVFHGNKRPNAIDQNVVTDALVKLVLYCEYVLKVE